MALQGHRPEWQDRDLWLRYFRVPRWEDRGEGFVSEESGWVRVGGVILQNVYTSGVQECLLLFRVMSRISNSNIGAFDGV